MKTNMKLIGLVLVLFLISINGVLAFGVSSPYWSDHPLEMYPGETKDVSFTLVNKVDDPTANAVVSMINDGGISQLTSGTDYTVLPGTSNTKVTLRVSVPDDAVIGTTYDVQFSVKSSPTEEGQVQLGVSYNVNFPVEVFDQTVEEPTTQGMSSFVWILIIAVLVIIVVVYLVAKKRK